MGIIERKKREKERRRQQIIIAAGRLFSKKGFSQVTVEDIAREAELSTGTLYFYFKSKEELYVSLSLRVLQYLNMRVEHVILATALSPRDKLDLLMEVMHDVYEYNPALIVNSIQLQSSELLKNAPPELISRIMVLSRNIVRVFSDIFEEGIQNKVFRTIPAIPAVALADIFISLFSGVVLWESGRQVSSRENPLKERLETAFGIFRRGIVTA